MARITAKRTPELAEAANRGEEAARKAMIEFIGDLSEVEVLGDNLLIGNYISPSKIGSIYRPGDNIKEDELQGNVGLVLKLGDGAALENGATEKFLHKWVMFGYNDGLRYNLNDVSCRTIDVGRIRQIVPDPSKVL